MGAASYLKPLRIRWLATVLLVLGSAACRTTPVTGRYSLNPFSTADDVQIGREAYAEVLKNGKPVTAGKDKFMVERVMTRLSSVADDPGFEWEVHLLEDEQANAFALPGGKMAVYTGILPICRGETGLAVVMGHEIGHVVARHGTERMTSTLGIDFVLSFLNLGDYAGLAQRGLDLFLTLPFGRKQESEADEIGLFYMARAGYDPREAIAFWERMEDQGGAGVPGFLSTHPSHASRVQHLKDKLPEALELWRAAGNGASR